MGDVVKFRKTENHIEYDYILDHDPYLKTAACNALQLAGYSVTKTGVMNFEKDFKLPEDGILSIDHFPVLLLYFDANTRQDILNYIEREKNSMKKPENKNDMLKAIITLVLLLFFELYGIISCIADIIHLIKG